jgi:hypothetical protein
MKKHVSTLSNSVMQRAVLTMWILIPLLALSLITFRAEAQTASLYVTSGGAVTAQNVAVNIASDALVTSTDNLTGATASITTNFVTGQDVLKINGLTSGSDGSISYAYNATSGVLTLTGSETAANYQTTLRKITYTNTSATPTITARTVTISLNKAIPYAGTGHYYEFISSANITWTNAKTAAEALNYFGLQGYLVTVTSSGENDFCKAKLTGNGWMGANDATTEGTWKWVTGPEAGTQFYSGVYPTGSCSSGQYCNWNGGEPNNCCSGEHYAHFLSGGAWNDFPNSVSGTIAGYVVEYGGSAGDPTLHISDNVQVTFPAPANPTSVTASYNPICSGGSTTLTCNGAVGTVYWYTVSCGGTATSPATGNTLAVSPTTGTTYYARNYSNAQYSAGCASFTVNVNPAPTVSSLVATGSVEGAIIKWYNAATGGTQYIGTETLVNNQVYYASQTINGVESATRLAVTASVGTH